MASEKVAKDSGICLSVIKQSSNIPIRVSGSSGDGEQSCSEQLGHAKLSSSRPSRIPIAVSQRGGENNSFENNQNKGELNTTDSGIYSGQRIEQELFVQKIEKSSKTLQSASKEAVSNSSNKLKAPRDTKANILRKKAHLMKKDAMEMKKKNKNMKKNPAEQCGPSPLIDDELSSRSGRECEYDAEHQSMSSDTNEEVNDQTNKETCFEETPCHRLELIPLVAEHNSCNLEAEKTERASDADMTSCQNSHPDALHEPKEETNDHRNSARKLESEREAEPETDLSADESFEESCSEYERTPTFEFNMTPPSIGNSGCGNSNNTMDNVPVRCCQEQANTASDVSDIEDQPVVSCQDGIYIETLRKQPGDMEKKSPQIEQVDHEEHINDDELNQMDAATFGLLQSAAEPPAVAVNNYTERRKLNYIKDKCSDKNSSIRSGQKRVHFASEPEIYEVSFSSREYDEPNFDVTDDTPPSTVQSESRVKSVAIDPYSKEFVDDPDDLLHNIDEEIEEEFSLEENQRIYKHSELITGTKFVGRQENYSSEKSSSVRYSELETLPHQELKTEKIFLTEEHLTDPHKALSHKKQDTAIIVDNEQGCHERVKCVDFDDLPRQDSPNSGFAPKENEDNDMKAISAEVEQFKNLYAKIGNIHETLLGKKKPNYETSLEKRNVCQTRLSLVQEIKIIMVSLAEMSEDFKSILKNVLELSLERDIAQVKKEHLETLNNKNMEIELLKKRNDEFKTQLVEADEEKRIIKSLITSINRENEKLLEENDILENGFKEVLAKQSFEEINDKHDSERELSNFRDNMRTEMDAEAWDQMWSDKQNLEKDLNMTKALLKESEATKTELAQQMKEMKTELDKLKVEQTKRNSITDHAYLREQVEHLKGLLVLSNLETERLQAKLDSVAKTSAIGNGTREFPHKDKLVKSDFEEELCQSNRQNMRKFRELTHPLEHNCQGKESHAITSAFEQFAKQIETVQDGLNQLRNEHSQTQRHVKRKSEVHYKRLKGKLICNEKNITSLTQFLQCNLKEVDKEREQDIQHQIHDMEQSKESRGSCLTEEESMDDLNMRELKELLNNIVTSLHRTQNEREKYSATIENGRDQTLERGFKDLKKLLEDTKLMAERNEMKLNERGHMVEQLNRQLLKERIDREKHLTWKEREVNKLERLLLDSNKNVDELQGRLKEISKELDGVKNTIAQKEIELTDCKALLREGDDLLSTSRQVIIEMQRELHETKQVLMKKNVALAYSEKYAEVLCNVTRTNDFEAAFLTNKMMNRVACNVKRVESLLQRKRELKVLKSETTTSQIEHSDVRPNDVNKPIREQVEVNFLNEKERNIGESKSSVTELSPEQGLQHGCAASPKEKGNELTYDLEKRDLEIRDLKSAINHLKEELELRITSEKEIESKLRRVTDDLCRKEKEIKELETFISDLKGDLELRSTLLRENELRKIKLQQMTRNIQRKEMQVEDLESSIVNLKRDLELSTTLLKEKENNLYLMTTAFHTNEMELKSTSEKSSLLEEERNCLHNKLMELKSHIIQQERKMKELDMLLFARDLQLKDSSSKVEKLQLQLGEKEQNIDLLKHSLAKKEHDIDGMTKNIKKKMFQIMRLEKTMDNVKIDKWKSPESYQIKTRYLEHVATRLQHDLQVNSILLQVKDKELKTANLRIQVKEEEIGAYKARLRRLRDKNELALYKQTSTERRFKPAHYNEMLSEKNDKEKQTESKVVDSYQGENEREELEMDNNEVNLEVLITKLPEEQVAFAIFDRMQQIMADMNIMQVQLEGKRGENSTLYKENKELKEYVNRLQEQAIEQEQMSSQRLKNALDHVRLKRAEIRRLKALHLQQDSTWGSEASTVNVTPQHVVPPVTKRVLPH